MSYKSIKWMILLIPTLTVAVWEYVRHEFLLPYISMTLGNWLTPVLVYLVSITLLTKLFSMLERIQKELEQERAAKAALEARERLARELHDGIAQSLFLLSVKAERLEHSADPEQLKGSIHAIRKTIHEVNRYVRQAIANLRLDVTGEVANEGSAQLTPSSSLLQQIHAMVDIPLDIEVNWRLADDQFSAKEKVELLACIREAVVNMNKHASASKGWIQGSGDEERWTVRIEDNGKGLEGSPFSGEGKYGLGIMRDRCDEMNWTMALYRDQQHTIVEIQKGVTA
ncbi:Sensor histidine kinase LiaS [compost metagenome]